MKNGELPISIMVTINGVHEEARIQRSIAPNLWNQDKGCSKGKDRNSLEINNFIDALKPRHTTFTRSCCWKKPTSPPLTYSNAFSIKERNGRCSKQ